MPPAQNRAVARDRVSRRTMLGRVALLGADCVSEKARRQKRSRRLLCYHFSPTVSQRINGN